MGPLLISNNTNLNKIYGLDQKESQDGFQSWYRYDGLQDKAGELMKPEGDKRNKKVSLNNEVTILLREVLGEQQAFLPVVPRLVAAGRMAGSFLLPIPFRLSHFPGHSGDWQQPKNSARMAATKSKAMAVSSESLPNDEIKFHSDRFVALHLHGLSDGLEQLMPYREPILAGGNIAERIGALFAAEREMWRLQDEYKGCHFFMHVAQQVHFSGLIESYLAHHSAGINAEVESLCRRRREHVMPHLITVRE
jgi:hypothetical protein